MRRPLRSIRPALALAGAAIALAASPPALASHEDQIEPDITKLPYAPIGHFKPGHPLPDADDVGAVREFMSDGLFNPSGSFNAFDTNVFEVLALPYRAAGDEFDDDPLGNGGEAQHGRCGDDPRSERERPGDFSDVAGECPNHQLEYVDYYERTMREILGDFGMSFHRYEFDNPGGSNTQSGRAINPAAVVPGAEHPEETVIIGAHYDQTNDGPASAWDSQEGHAQIIRVAKLMADYWKSTGTRPAATVKFIPWDGEESGTLGSLDYATNNIVPGQEADVRGYWNTDPCSGGYPAFRYGNPADRVDLKIQLANIRPSDDPVQFNDTMPPAEAERRFAAFNARARETVEQVFDQLDDTLAIAPGANVDIFVSTEEGKTHPLGSDIGRDVVLTTSRPILFGSDWANFEALGIPFFNPGPDITGPSTQLGPGNPDALAILHSPNDNLQTLNAYTGARKDGREMSEGWMKGMELCAQMLGWGMLQPEQAGAAPASDGTVAYYEALPNEASAGKPVEFDASGSHARVDGVATEEGLKYRWDFGDGSKGRGRVVEHSYAEPGVYQSRLTVKRPGSGRPDTMTVPITVERSSAEEVAGPKLTAPAEDADGTFSLSWTYDREGVEAFAVEEGTSLLSLLADDAEDLDAWTAEDPTEERIAPWQLSDSTTPKTRGNLRHGGARSFWTGVAAQDQEPFFGPGEGVSSLTVKKPIELPEGKTPVLSYWSDFQNDANDFAHVEVAIDEGGALEWDRVDTFGGRPYARGFQGHALHLRPNFEHRTVDLSRYAGRRIRLRFSYVLGPTQFINVFRNGWYLDDISLTVADFAEIGRTQEKTFEVAGRAPGTYLYRVQALFADGTRSAASNTEQVTVTGG